jgi:hypothetical protein
MTTTLETPTACGLTAVLIPRGLTAAQLRAVRTALGLTCRHGQPIRETYGRCPACAANHQPSRTDSA